MRGTQAPPGGNSPPPRSGLPYRRGAASSRQGRGRPRGRSGRTSPREARLLRENLARKLELLAHSVKRRAACGDLRLEPARLREHVVVGPAQRRRELRQLRIGEL